MQKSTFFTTLLQTLPIDLSTFAEHVAIIFKIFFFYKLAL